MRIEENKSTKFWFNKLNELKSIRVKDTLIDTSNQIQQFIIRQIRSSTQFMPYLKSTIVESGLLDLELFDEKMK